MSKSNSYSAIELMSMNRKDRRRLGKVYHVKIPGFQDETPDQKKKRIDNMRPNLKFASDKKDSVFNIAENTK